MYIYIYVHACIPGVLVGKDSSACASLLHTTYMHIHTHTRIPGVLIGTHTYTYVYIYVHACIPGGLVGEHSSACASLLHTWSMPQIYVMSQFVHPTV